MRLAVLFLSIASLVNSSSDVSANPDPRRPVAIVNGEHIRREDFDRVVSFYFATSDPLGLTNRQTVERELLDVMITELIFKQFLRKNVPAPAPAVIESRLRDLETSLRKQQKTLAQYLQESGQTEESLRADITAVVQWNGYVHKHATDEDLKKCFERNRELIEGASIRVRHIFLRWPEGTVLKSRKSVTDKLASIRQEILAGLDFADAAKKYSEDESSATEGGDLGFFPPQPRDPDVFIRTASELKAGQVSDLVETGEGCHLIQVIDRRPGTPTRFEDAKDFVRPLWADELRMHIIDRERRNAKIDIMR